MAGNSFPVGVSQTLLWKVRNFPEDVYSFNPQDRLTALMNTLLGEAGIGQLSAVQVASRTLQTFPYYSDLDQVLGKLLNSPRLVSELYSTSINPFTDQLSLAQWQDVNSKDSNYRERLLATAAALLRGATVLGLLSMAEATSQIKFQVIENWTSASSVVTASGYGLSGLDGPEVIFLPLIPSGLTFDNNLRYSTQQSILNLQPLGTSVVVYTGSISPYSSVPYSSISGNNTFSYLERTVTANNISIPASIAANNDPTVANRYWLRNGTPKSAPYFAFGQTQEEVIDVTNNITGVSISYNGTPERLNNGISPLGTPNLAVTNNVLGG